ncbi:hypothetical protein [Paenibacillus sp. NEAU-GSW1]|uniref:hypothetical protein n=1 Tax=Paenibacillus sp. NEAU-GSW1 TaxID=2682486 RepID=UPI0012E2B168|nr:hypothetical protein [Paenibacillus sp. NEAU-GSW1]MUT67881.1 hypothetical protein [Paenibacillus sp. NEAU-GSW1]
MANVKAFLAGAAIVSACSLSLYGCSANPSVKENKTYGHDGYLGYSNSNPNIPNNFSYLNYKSDGKFAGQVLDGLKGDGVESNQLFFNGEHLRAVVNVRDDMSDAEKENVRQKAQKLLQTNMPRYEVTVEAVR